MKKEYLPKLNKPEYYRDFYGCTASIREKRNGTFRLIMSTPQGKLIQAKDYNTYRGAKIAMGRSSDCWERRR